MSKKNWIKKLREESGLTQKEAAFILSVSERTWRRWEGNKFPPPVHIQLAIKCHLKKDSQQ